MTRSSPPPFLATRNTHFVIRVGGKAAGFMDSRAKADELAALLNDIPGCPAVSVDELIGPFPADYDAALAALRSGKRAEPDARDERPVLRLIRGGR